MIAGNDTTMGSRFGAMRLIGAERLPRKITVGLYDGINAINQAHRQVISPFLPL